MENWRRYISNKILPLVKNNAFWKNYLDEILANKRPSIGIHLGIFIEPYLSFVLDGKKTVESRFGKTKHSPYGNIENGDIVLIKKSGGDIVGLCKVTNVWFYHLDAKSWKFLREEFTVSLCAQDPEFWHQRKSASFATLMKITSVIQIPPVSFSKADRRGWVVLRPPNVDMNL